MRTTAVVKAGASSVMAPRVRAVCLGAARVMLGWPGWNHTGGSHSIDDFGRPHTCSGLSVSPRELPL